MLLSRIGRQMSAALVLATAAAGTAQAATDGQLGTTSTGTVDITASVAASVQISGLQDVTFNAVDPTNPVSDAQDVCVWSNAAGSRYRITATGDGAGNAFTLSGGGSLAPVSYSVEWAASAGQTAGSALAVNTAQTALTSAATHPTCNSGPANSASLVVGMSSADLQTMQAGVSYTGTLTLVVAPD